MEQEVIIKSEKRCFHCNNFLNVNVYPYEDLIKIELRCENEYCLLGESEFVKEVNYKKFQYVGTDVNYMIENHLNLYHNKTDDNWECKLCGDKFTRHKTAKKHLCDLLVTKR